MKSYVTELCVMCNVLAMNHRHLNFYNSVANPNIKNSTSSIYMNSPSVSMYRGGRISQYLAYWAIDW